MEDAMVLVDAADMLAALEDPSRAPAAPLGPRRGWLEAVRSRLFFAW
jgi:hypothetical protein